MITYLKLKHDTFGVTWRSFWGIWIGDWTLKSHTVTQLTKLFGSVYCQQCFEVVKPFVKNGVKTSVAGFCTIENFSKFIGNLHCRSLPFNKFAGCGMNIPSCWNSRKLYSAVTSFYESLNLVAETFLPGRNLTNNRSSHQRCSTAKVFLKISQN